MERDSIKLFGCEMDAASLAAILDDSLLGQTSSKASCQSVFCHSLPFLPIQISILYQSCHSRQIKPPKMSLITDIYRVNEKVQVIDETTGIWEDAKIVWFPSSWSVKVRLTNWSTAKAGLPIISVAKHTDVFQWPIRKSISEPILLLGPRRKRSRRNEAVQNPHRKVRFEEVHYVERCHDDATDIERPRRPAVTVKKGKVMTNDPFSSKLVVAPEENPKQLLTVYYEQLRCEPTDEPQVECPVNRESEESPETADSAQITEQSKLEPRVQPKQPKRVSGSIAKVAPVSLEIRLNEIFFLMDASEDGLPLQVDLTVVPCRNGILEKAVRVIDDSNQTCCVQRLYFDSKKRKARAELVG